MKKLLSIAIAFLFFNQLSGQNFFSDFIKYQESDDSANQLKTLKAWEAANINDAELYTSYLNYYFAKSRTENLVLATQMPDGQTIALADSTGKDVGYFSSQVEYAKTELLKGIDWINRGIALYPDRLDMRLGKIYALGELQDWNSFTSNIIDAVHRSAVNNNEWTWTNNEKVNYGKQNFLASLQDYQKQLFDSGNQALLMKMGEIAEEILKIYPDHVESLSNLSVASIVSKDYAKAIDLLLKAEKISPQDYIVLMNLAHCYREQGDKTRAIEYYEKVKKYADGEALEYAKSQIKELKKGSADK